MVNENEAMVKRMQRMKTHLDNNPTKNTDWLKMDPEKRKALEEKERKAREAKKKYIEMMKYQEELEAEEQAIIDSLHYDGL